VISCQGLHLLRVKLASRFTQTKLGINRYLIIDDAIFVALVSYQLVLNYDTSALHHFLAGGLYQSYMSGVEDCLQSYEGWGYSGACDRLISGEIYGACDRLIFR
jgi:hypothetical protein